MIRIYNRVRDAGESLQPLPHGSGMPHTYKAGAGDPWPAPDPEPMACTGPRAHGLHRPHRTPSPWPAPDPEPMATRSPIESGSIKPKAGDPAGALGIHGDPVAGVTC